MRHHLFSRGSNDIIAMDSSYPQIKPEAENIRKRFETFVKLYTEEFTIGLGQRYADSIFLSKELLHCAVNAYFDDIYKYKAYAGSKFADRHKQAAFTMIWLTRFKPIQIKHNSKIEAVHLTINEAFAIYAGLVFLNPAVMKGMTKSFYNHLIYTLTYRKIEGRTLATILYLMEKASVNGIRIGD